MITQLITVAAVLVGAAASYFVTRASERERFNREMKVRWDRPRLDAYVAYISALKMEYTTAQKMFDILKKDSTSAEIQLLLDTLQQADLRRAEMFETVMLLADAPTIQAAHELNTKMWRLERSVCNRDDLEKATWYQFTDAWIVALNNFHESARASLGVSGGISRRDVALLLPSPRADQDG
ncbi:hypothetical protein [Nonomuraea rhizosphaerae]|uniref:hypothetical protein n=1 Tax=Nonomuraea rhizosphaerae TaxID=2665663 RepID=UPI001C5CE428|nr:hypothetical protein [Nonomuraea rhizosphaerae]